MIASVPADAFSADHYVVEQLIRPIANLYRVSTNGTPVAFVRQKKLAIKEDLRFFEDEQETRELFRIKARSVIDVRGTYDVTDQHGQTIGALQKDFVTSLARSTWNVFDAQQAAVAVAREQSAVIAILRRVVDLPIPFHFDIEPPGGGERLGVLSRSFTMRDKYDLDLAGDPERRLDRRLAIALAVALDALQSR